MNRGGTRVLGQQTTPAVVVPAVGDRWATSKKGVSGVVGTQGKGLRFGIVVSRFNPDITGRLLSGALAVLKKGGVPLANIQIEEVPGAFELPGVAQQMGKSGRFNALICLGAVIRGGTEHFHYICSEVSRGIGQVSLTLGMPVIFGVLTTESLRQAQVRSGSKINKGAEAAEAAIEMGMLYRKIGKGTRERARQA